MFQKKVVGKYKTNFYVQKVFFSPENRVVNGIMWKTVAKPNRP